jgi:hypothetical protein
LDYMGNPKKRPELFRGEWEENRLYRERAWVRETRPEGSGRGDGCFQT